MHTLKEITKQMEHLINETNKVLKMLNIDKQIAPKYSPASRLSILTNELCFEYKYLWRKEQMRLNALPSGDERYPYKLLNQNGYMDLWDKDFNDLVVEHRYVMQKYLKRKLHRNEHVHHIDKNRANNKIENLKLLSASAHIRLHSTKKHKG